jgi:DNA-binding transcriptional ArsR family regulator
MKEVAKKFSALSDQTRLKILEFIMNNGRHCVLEIAHSLQISQTSASRNLAILSDAGFLSVERVGACTYYELKEENLSLTERLIIEALAHSFQEQKKNQLLNKGL